MSNEGAWLSITDYSQYKNISISTIRRHIKSNLLRYKEESGKYLIFVPSKEKIKIKEEGEILKLRLEVEEIKENLKKLKEENNELKMLVELYEAGKIIASTDATIIPEIPETNT